MQKDIVRAKIDNISEELFAILLTKVEEISPAQELDKEYLRRVFDKLSSKVEAEFLEERVREYNKIK